MKKTVFATIAASLLLVWPLTACGGDTETGGTTTVAKQPAASSSAAAHSPTPSVDPDKPAGNAPKAPAKPLTQQATSKEIDYCGDPWFDGYGFTYFTDGTTGWSAGCDVEMHETWPTYESYLDDYGDYIFGNEYDSGGYYNPSWDDYDPYWDNYGSAGGYWDDGYYYDPGYGGYDPGDTFLGWDCTISGFGCGDSDWDDYDSYGGGYDPGDNLMGWDDTINGDY